jgi:hypothetical protein
MEASRINALIASAYNIHVGPVVRGEAMTPAKAAMLPRAERVNLCRMLEQKGGSDLYSKKDAAKARAQLESE